MRTTKERFVYLSIIFFCVMLLCFCAGDPAFSQESFYKGKTITLIQGREPGGSGDLRARAVASYLQKYIPGNPTILFEYMPGGGGRKAANHIAKVASPDGLTIAHMGGGFVANGILGAEGVLYDVDKLMFLGNPNSEVQYVFLTHAKLGLSSLEKLRAYSGLRIAAQAVGHDQYTIARLLAWLLDLKAPKFVVGYSGPEVYLAVENGEADGRAATTESVMFKHSHWVEKRVVDFHVIHKVPKGKNHPSFAKLPELETLARSQKELNLIGLQRNMELGGTAYVAPPGTPAERVAILREAMRKAFKDPEFLTRFKKDTGITPTPITGEEQEKYVREVPRDRETIELFKKFTTADPLPPR
jgi:tripartite-type tricarboxylate transporter receptor subunit TctC